MSDALLNHILSQTKQNIDFLVSQGHLSQVDANIIKGKLPAAGSSSSTTAPPASTLSTFRNGLRSTPSPAPAARAVPVPVPTRRAVPIPTPVRMPSPAAPAEPEIQYGRAIWGYNENGQESDDLSFAAGDIIQLVEETNGDWWTGKHRGRQALFPSNYVEKISAAEAANAPPRYQPPPYPADATAASSTNEKQPYRPFLSAQQSAPPPAQGQETNNVGLQGNEAEQEQKKGKFGKYKETMAHSAAGGLGFGAGAAIGGGIINSIF